MDIWVFCIGVWFFVLFVLRKFLVVLWLDVVILDFKCGCFLDGELVVVVEIVVFLIWDFLELLELVIVIVGLLFFFFEDDCVDVLFVLVFWFFCCEYVVVLFCLCNNFLLVFFVVMMFDFKWVLWVVVGLFIFVVMLWVVVLVIDDLFFVCWLFFLWLSCDLGDLWMFIFVFCLMYLKSKVIVNYENELCVIENVYI